MNLDGYRWIVIVALAPGIAPAWAAGAPAPSGAERVYQQERARCFTGEAQQPLDPCLKEAAAALAEARRGTLGASSASELARNATRRCDAQPPADRGECIRRIEGPGKIEGSVGGGGLLRSSETTEIR